MTTQMDNIFGIPSKLRAICENEKQDYEIVTVQDNAGYPKTNETGGLHVLVQQMQAQKLVNK